MALTCLQIIQTTCNRLGIVSPNAAVTSTDQQILQLLALSNSEGAAQVKRYNWEVLQTEATFTTLAVQLQGTIASIAPGMKFIINNTIWNRSLRRPIPGSVSAQDWQELQAMNISAPYGKFRIRGDSLYIYPVPVAGNTCAFEYSSKNWLTKSVGGTSSVWTNDADLPLLDDDLLILGLTWRWKAAKGLDYSEDFNTYEAAITDAMARDGGKPALNTSGAPTSISPVVLVPSGSWGV